MWKSLKPLQVTHHRLQPPEVVKILYDNKTKLVAYLDGLHKDREKSDEQFRDEKGLIVSTLEALQIEGT